MWLIRKQIRSFRHLGILSLLIVLGMTPVAHATSCSTNVSQQTCSTTYGVSEAFFGTGGELHPCSTTYCSKQAAGELAIGATGSTTYKAQAGFNTDRTPSLTFVVPAQNINLGTLTPGTTATTTATFSVYSYLSSGYIVQTVGAAPTNSGHQLNPLSSPTASNSSAEQFGINLKANTSPTTFGANPSQIPDATFGFGTAATGYDTANVYKYVANDTIAQSLSSTGETDFTISYIFNATALTPGGTYTMNQVLVATATF